MILTALVLAATLHLGAEIPVTEPIPNASPYRQHVAAVAASDDVALLVWVEEQQLGAARIDRDGKRLDARPIALSSAPVHARPDAARGANDWLVVWSEGYGESSLAARFVDDNGVAGELFTLAELPFPVVPRVAFDGTHFLVAWREEGVLRGARLTAAGQLVEVKELARARVNYGEFDLVALSTGFALVAVHFEENDYIVEALRFTTNAELHSYTWLDRTTSAHLGSVFALADGDTLVAMWASTNGVYVAREHQQIRNLGMNLAPHGIVKIGGTVHLLLRRAEADEVFFMSEDGSQTRSLEASSPQTRFTSLAAASFGDRALVATAQHAFEPFIAPADDDIHTHLVDERQQEIVAPQRLAIEPARQINPALARRNGSESLAVWLESGGDTPPMLMAMRIDNAGRPLDPAPVPVARVFNTFARPQVASDGTGYLVIWSDGSTVSATALRADGTRGPIADLGATRTLYPCVAWNGAEYVVAQVVFSEAPWFVRTKVQVTRVSRDGSAGAATIVSGIDQHEAVSCASAGGQTLIAWGGPEQGVAGTIVRADGTATGEFPIHRAAIHLGNVATDGERFAVSWRGPQGMGWSILNGQGTVSHVGQGPPEGYNPQIAARRNGWVVAWQAGASDLYAAALDRDGVIVGPRLSLADSPLIDQAVALAGGDIPIAIYMRELETTLHSRWRVFTRVLSDIPGRRRATRH